MQDGYWRPYDSKTLDFESGGARSELPWSRVKAITYQSPSVDLWNTGWTASQITITSSDGSERVGTISDAQIEGIASFGEQYKLRVGIPMFRDTVARIDVVP